MNTTLLIEVIGGVGLASYVLAYGLLQLGIIRGNGYIYPLMNIIGASFVAISLLNNWNLWSALNSLCFTIFSLIGMVRVYLHNRELVFDEQEQNLYEKRFRLLSRLDMRRILERGIWMNGQEGEVLTTQGRPVTYLSYLYSGCVEVEVGGQTIAEVGPGEFIGEMACFDKGPASATVRLAEPTRYFRISSDALRNLVKSNPDLRAQMEFAFAGNIRTKLLATNAKLQSVLEDQAGTSNKAKLERAAKRSNT